MKNLKLLGITIIDSNLSFSSHYQNVCIKTSTSMSVLSKPAYYFSQPILKKLYQTVIYPRLKWHWNLGKLVHDGRKKTAKNSKQVF